MSKSTLLADLSEITANMRGQANREDITVCGDEMGLLMEAMDQYADQIDKRLAAEATSDEGMAGTHAYDMLAVAAEREVATTEALIHMVAATVLMQGIERQITGWDKPPYSRSVTFSPLDMDVMFRTYDMDVTRDGISTVVTITKRNAPELGLKHAPGVDIDEPALPQATAKPHDRPYWFAKIGPERIEAADRIDAEELVKSSLIHDSTIVAEVENRQCPRADCPNPDNQGMCAACSTI